MKNCVKSSNLSRILGVMDSVERISNLHEMEGVINFLFFMCPKMTARGMIINKPKTGLTAKYVEGVNTSTIKRMKKVRSFLGEIKNEKNIRFEVTAIYAAADSVILFPIPVEVPQPPEMTDGIKVVSNLEAVKNRMSDFNDIYNSQPWKKESIQRFVSLEEKRMAQFLDKKMQNNIKKDFIRRVFAGFALDGIFMRERVFGSNPVILGVESPGVPILQNSTLGRGDWVPVVSLK